MDKNLKAHIEYLLCVKIEQVRSISGGDISKAYLITTDSECFFCKINHNQDAYEMFLAEKMGLEAVALTKTIPTPKVFLCEPLESGGLLVMEYIEPKSPTPKEMKLFGHQLAGLHQISESDSFGWEIDNFIGSLAQSNQAHFEWADFYVQERLLPQLKIAHDLQRLAYNEIPQEERLLKACNELFPKVAPSLLHGDLWSGNYLISKDGTPYLIDPAVYRGHSEIDLAMTRLFGGFSASFYDAYSQHFPEIGGEKERNDIYQLYYLLVHLNLFGSSYVGSVKSILKEYF